MDADKLAYFGTIKSLQGGVKAAFCILFLQVSLLLYNKDFLQCFIIKSFSGILLCCWANRIALSNIFSEIDG